MINIDDIVRGLPALASIGTLVLASLGLSTWRKKLWGENRFSLATSVVRELYVLIGVIRDFRAPAYSEGEIYAGVSEFRKSYPEATIDDPSSAEYAEKYRWEALLAQFQNFNSVLIRLKVMVDDFEIDEIDGVKFEDFVREISSKRTEAQFRKKNMDLLMSRPGKERERFLDEQEEIHRVLSCPLANDDFGQRMEGYFVEFRRRMRKYIV